MKCDFNNEDFEECNENDMSNEAHEMCCQCSALRNADFLPAGHDNIFTYEHFATGKDSDNDDSKVVEEENELGSVTTNPSSLRIVSDLPFDHFRGKLVEHFDIIF